MATGAKSMRIQVFTFLLCAVSISIGFSSYLYLAGQYQMIISGYEWTDDGVRNSSLRLRGLKIFKGHIGRPHTNGTWQPLGGSAALEGYVFTAFYDDRAPLGSFPVIRVIAVVDSKPSNLSCVLKYKNNDTFEYVQVEKKAVGFGVRKHKDFQEFIFSCPLKHFSIPDSVGIIATNQQNDKNISATDTHQDKSFAIPIEVPFEPKPQKEFCVCVSVSYWKLDPKKIIEWMEILKILGVSLVTIYNNSLANEPSKVFLHYQKEGFVDFRQSHNFIKDPAENTIHLHMSPVINDCIYRNMYNCKKIIITDVDELIIPRNVWDYQALIKDIDKHQKGCSKPIFSYVFRNNYFFTDIPVGKDRLNTNLVTLDYRKKVNITAPGNSVKSIIDPLVCSAMHNHYCWEKTSEEFCSVDVDPKLGLNQHYKKCHLDNYDGSGTCKKLISTAVKDDIMLRWSKPLIKNVNEKLEIIYPNQYQQKK